MLPSTKVALAGCVVAAAVSLWIERTWDGASSASVALGVGSGFLAGAAVALGVGVAQRRIARAMPAYLIHVLGAGFLLKLFSLLALTLAVRFVPSLGAALEWRALMLSFAAAVLVLLPCTAFELVRLAQSAGAARSSGLAYQPGSPS